MSREQFVIDRLSEWGTRNEWSAKWAKTKLREYQDKSNRDVLRRQAGTDRRAA